MSMTQRKFSLIKKPPVRTVFALLLSNPLTIRHVIVIIGCLS